MGAFDLATVRNELREAYLLDGKINRSQDAVDLLVPWHFGQPVRRFCEGQFCKILLCLEPMVHLLCSSWKQNVTHAHPPSSELCHRLMRTSSILLTQLWLRIVFFWLGLVIRILLTLNKQTPWRSSFWEHQPSLAMKHVLLCFCTVVLVTSDQGCTKPSDSTSPDQVQATASAVPPAPPRTRAAFPLLCAPTLS
jgi:hypothetical protein